MKAQREYRYTSTLSFTSALNGVCGQQQTLATLPLGKIRYPLYRQGRPLGGASGALAPGADFEGAPKRRSPSGHTLIRSTVAW
jgi:hypothetical protein